MSRENVEVVAKLHAEFERTRHAVPKFLAPDFVWDMSTFRGWPDDAEYYGAEGFDRFLAAWVAPWDDWSLEIEDMVDMGDDEVLVLMRQGGIPKGAQARVELQYGTVYTLREGLITRARVYASPSEAREAVGLPE
jgi:ketosteroid isomerase-like protein